MIELTFNVTSDPDLCGFFYYVPAGAVFDADDYADAYNLPRHDIDPQTIHSVHDSVSRLNPGEWIAVSH